MKVRLLIFFLFPLILSACSASRENLTGPLTTEERRKLDPQLHFLFDNPAAGPASTDLDIIALETGGIVVGVNVHLKDASVLYELKIKASSWKDGVASCYVDPIKLRELLNERSVTRVLAKKGVLPAK